MLATAEWVPPAGIVLARHLIVAGDRAAFFARVRAGEFLALYRGAYVRAAEWERMDRHARYRTRVAAAAASTRGELVFSHQSAAALWRLPLVGEWPARAHVLTEPSAGGRSTETIVRHAAVAPGEFATIDGLTVTSLARTVVDLARVLPFGPAVALADAALRRTEYPLHEVPRTFVDRKALEAELESVPLRHGSARVRRLIEFADAAADRPGESMSRASMRLARLPTPRLQVPMAGASGRVYSVDFWWPEFGLIGEFDGRYKYSDPEFLRGRTPQQVVYDEKLREDDLRAAGHGMSRWGWAVAASPQLLAAQLRRAGIS